MKFGIVGVGKWGVILAEKFVKCGAEIAWHDRANTESSASDFGERRSWKSAITDLDTDFVVAAAPPEISFEVFNHCVRLAKPVFVTKPLFIEHVPELKATTYVDYIHLNASAYDKVRHCARESGVKKISINFEGHGPERSFPGFFDYGPHALAFVFDLLPGKDIIVARATRMTGHPRRELVQATLYAGDAVINLTAGNDAPSKKQRLEVSLQNGPDVGYFVDGKTGIFTINGRDSLFNHNHDPLNIMVERFLWDVEANRVDNYFVELSAKMLPILTKVRRLAGLPG